MKIGFMSDSHDNMPAIRSAVRFFRDQGVKQVVHCGDIVSPFAIPAIKGGEFEKCTAVFGNNDGEWLMLSTMFRQVGEIIKPPIFIEIYGKRIAVLHEPMPMDVMDSMPVDIVAFGHTHEPVIKPGRPMVINPGECCGYLSGRSTVIIVNTENMEAELIELDVRK